MDEPASLQAKAPRLCDQRERRGGKHREHTVCAFSTSFPELARDGGKRGYEPFLAVTPTLMTSLQVIVTPTSRQCTRVCVFPGQHPPVAPVGGHRRGVSPRARTGASLCQMPVK